MQVLTVLNPAPAPVEGGLQEELLHLTDIICTPFEAIPSRFSFDNWFFPKQIGPNEPETEMLTGLPVGTIEEASVAVLFSPVAHYC